MFRCCSGQAALNGRFDVQAEKIKNQFSSFKTDFKLSHNFLLKVTLFQSHMDQLRLEQSVASQHLAILRRAGVVVTERQGKFIYYTVDKERINHISRLVEELTEQPAA